MAFADEVVKDGRGVCFKFDISLDFFSSISYRYSTHGHVDATNEYDPRIRSLGSLSRGLGSDHIVQTGTFDMVLANDDELADWFVDRANINDVMKARGRLYLGLLDPADTARPPTITWKQLGEFVISDHPTRSIGFVSMAWSDDSLGILHQAAATPTIMQWLAADGDPATNPFADLTRDDYLILLQDGQANIRLPLAWGDEAHPCFLPTLAATLDTLGNDVIPVILCCTTSTASVGTMELTNFYVELESRPGVPYEVPQTWHIKGATSYWSSLVRTVWQLKKSEPIVVAGKTLYVLWIAIDAAGFKSWLAQLPTENVMDFDRHIYDDLAAAVNFSVAMPELTRSYYTNAFSTVTRAWARGRPLSARTTSTVVQQSVSDILTDIVTHYSRGSASNLDTTSIARVQGNAPSLNNFIMLINHAEEPGQERPLVEHLSDLAASADVDVFLTWEGKVGLAARNLDYLWQTATIGTIDETRIQDLSESIPSRQQRGAPYNAIALSDYRDDLGRPPEFATPGPFYTTQASPPIPVATKVMTKTLSMRCRPITQWRDNPWSYRNVDTIVRPRVTFTTDLEALKLELGDYFNLSWSRNMGTNDPFTETTFQLEEVALDLKSNTVEVTAIWANDLRSDVPFLLDDETLIARAIGSGGRTATVGNGSATVTFSSGNLTSDGVVAGDHLILMDATQGPTSFERNRALKIATVGTTTLTITDPDLAFGSVSVAVSNWEIRASKVTHQTGGSYPDGGGPYGALTDVNAGGVYSNAAAGNKLLDG